MDRPRSVTGARRFPRRYRRPHGPPIQGLGGIVLDLDGLLRFAVVGLPGAVATLAEEQHGLVLVTGLAGSGKTATLAAMVDHVNTQREGHIITIEDPVEVLHPDKRSIVDQREVGADTPTAVS